MKNLPLCGQVLERKASFRAILVSSTGVALVAVCTALTARAADTSSGVVSVLEKKYQVTETTPDHEQITKDGTTMAMKTAGVYALPTSDMMVPDTKVADGKVQAPSMFVRMTWTKMGSHVLQTGDKVYITKIDDKNESTGILRFTLLTVDSLDATGQSSQKKYQANVTFKFKKGYLDEAPPEDVEQAIEAVMAPDTGNSQGGGDANGQDQAQGGPATPAPAPQRQTPPPPPPPPPPPKRPAATISIGESSTEVLQAMGMPLQMIDLGKKKTYVYKDMKVIFLNDKVSDVE